MGEVYQFQSARLRDLSRPRGKKTPPPKPPKGIKRHTLEDLLVDAQEGMSEDGRVPIDTLLDCPMVFATGPNKEVELLSFYYSDGKIYVDLEA